MGVNYNTFESSSINAEYPKDMSMPNQYGFGGLSVHKFISAATTNNTFIKKGGGSVYGFTFYNQSGSPLWVRLFDKASAPVDADISIMSFVIPAAANGGTITISLPVGISFKSGIGFNVTTGGNDGNAGATAANEAFGSIFWK
tara:strand:+ start:4999 stop:5427 length:429 start_codon:yes stop_codon:yes gene_type:complete